MFAKVHVFRIKPGHELLAGIAGYCREKNISSALVIGIIGSVESASLNFLRELPGKYVTESYTGPLEIVCAQGSIALKDGETILHVHIQLSSQDVCRGGHLVEAKVFSTAEVAIAELDYQLHRYADCYTGLNELES